MMELLISIEDIKKYFDIANGRNEKEINKYIQEAQMFEFKQLFPEKFFNDLLKNKNETNYSELLDGKEYEYDDFNYSFEGLKAVLAHFTYSIYMLKGNMKDTSFGLVNKNSNQSDPVDFKERNTWSHSYKKQADMLWQDVKNYLDRFASEFPIWEECINSARKSFKTKVIQ